MSIMCYHVRQIQVQTEMKENQFLHVELPAPNVKKRLDWKGWVLRYKWNIMAV